MLQLGGYAIGRPTLVAGVLAVVGVLVGIGGILSARSAHRRISRALGGVRRGDTTLEQQLARVLADAESRQDRERELRQELERLAFLQRHALSRTGLVRYNPFEDTGADLSFSLAVLTDELNGLVLTSLWGRDEVRVYAKPIQEGTSRYALSQEEKQAIDLAKTRRLPTQSPGEERVGSSSKSDGGG